MNEVSFRIRPEPENVAVRVSDLHFAGPRKVLGRLENLRAALFVLHGGREAFEWAPSSRPRGVGGQRPSGAALASDPSRSASSRGVVGVRLPHQEFEILVNVRRCGQSKVDAVPEPAERLDPMQTSVLDRAPQPESGIQPIVVHDCAGKSDPCLKHDPRLLCVHGHRPACARQCAPLVEELPHDKGPVLEVVGQSVVAARVPEISTGKPMPALGASPQRRSFRHHVSSNPVLVMSLLIFHDPRISWISARGAGPPRSLAARSPTADR
jgi:hypothetical protein